MGKGWTDGPQGTFRLRHRYARPESRKGQQHWNQLIKIFLIVRMSWRWRGVEGDETGTRGGAGAAAGQPEKISIKLLKKCKTFFKRYLKKY